MRNPCGSWEFQSTLPQGERLGGIETLFKDSAISIHAPTRGATHKGTFNIVVPLHFNPRSHKGSDNWTSRNGGADLIFQSTLPQGERRSGQNDLSGYAAISIHAPTRGATTQMLRHLSIDIISIHAPTRGATTVRVFLFCKSLISIHAPTRGATLPHCFIRRFTSDFNPRSHKGSDDRLSMQYRYTTISIHAPTRGATSSKRKEVRK